MDHDHDIGLPQQGHHSKKPQMTEILVEPGANLGNWQSWTLTLWLKIAQKPYIVWSLGPKAFKCQSLESKGKLYSTTYPQSEHDEEAANAKAPEIA